MKLINYRVTEFRSVLDSEEIAVGDVTCLVGKNEAGKTALLKALYRLNPIVDEDAQFDVAEDYPRKEVGDYQHAVDEGDKEVATAITAVFELSDVELAKVRAVFGPYSLPSGRLTLSKTYANARTFILSGFDDRMARDHVARTSTLPETSKATLFEAKTWPELATKIEALEESAEKTRLKTLAVAIGTNDASHYAYNTILKPHLPKFLYFDEYYQMRGHENVPTLLKRQEEGKLKPSDRPLLGLVSLARLELKDLVNTKRTLELKNRLEGAGNHLTKQILKYWSQNKHLRMEFDLREGRPEDPAGMQSGQNLWGQVYDTVHWAHTELGSRSKGFVWFFSFLAWYEDVKRKKENVILLLDEPGMSLHGRAQEDLLKYIETELKPHHQVIYTTHSPFMIDPDYFDRVRIVQDRSIDSDDPLPREEDGTKVLSDVFDASDDSLFPLQGALGYGLHQSLFIGPNCLVVEGPADLLFLKAISSILERKGRTGLSERWTITPAGGAGKVGAFVALLVPQKGLKVATLLDIQPSDKDTIEALYKRKLLEKKRVLTYGEFVGSDQADVEDMFERVFYLELVNAEYEKSLAKPIQIGDLNASVPRVVKAIEQHLKGSPLKKGEFGHYRPARYFSENLGTLESKLSKATLDRFEAAFEKLNALLKPVA